jgi:hypothetical protein
VPRKKIRLFVWLVAGEMVLWRGMKDVEVQMPTQRIP